MTSNKLVRKLAEKFRAHAVTRYPTFPGKISPWFVDACSKSQNFGEFSQRQLYQNKNRRSCILRVPEARNPAFNVWRRENYVKFGSTTFPKYFLSFVSLSFTKESKFKLQITHLKFWNIRRRKSSSSFEKRTPRQ